MRFITTLASIVFTVFLVSCMGTDQNDQTGNANHDIIESENRITDPYEARTSINHKEEIVFIYIDSPNIRQYNDSTLVKTLISLKKRVSEKADSLNMGFLAMGVAITWDVNQGYDHLSKFGSFDELLIGNNWIGTGGLKYIFEDIPGRQGIPQIVLTKRVYDADESDDGTVRNFRGIESEEQIARHIGEKSFESWLNDGLLIPGY